MGSDDALFLCPGVAHTATLRRGKNSHNWDGDFGDKTTAQNIADLINMDKATSRSSVLIGNLKEHQKSLHVHDEFLATANSDEGDGIVMLSSMRSTEEGEDITIATNNPNAFEFSLGQDVQSTITNVSGSNFTVSDASTFTRREGLVFYTTGGTTYVARCSRVENVFTVNEDLTTGFVANLANDLVVKQLRLKTDVIDEARQKDWWSMEDNGAIMFNNQYPFYENHSLKVSYIYGERYLDKAIKEACIKLVCMDIYLTDDYTVLFPEGTSNIDLNSKVQKLDEEVKRMLIPYQESIIVAGMGG